jgi:hypothetical protein
VTAPKHHFCYTPRTGDHQAGPAGLADADIKATPLEVQRPERNKVVRRCRSVTKALKSTAATGSATYAKLL